MAKSISKKKRKSAVVISKAENTKYESEEVNEEIYQQ